ncbi:MAG: hypothetical protein ACUVS2_01815 [Candidatus Flexifilum sp.]|jgi:hypothetical protein
MIGSSPQEQFRLILLTVVGQAFERAGYRLDETPTIWAGGLFRFRTTLRGGPYDGLHAFIEFQFLHYIEGRPALFRVHLIRTDRADPSQPTSHPDAVRRLLTELVVRDFGVPIVPSAEHWWSYRDIHEMGRALGEAGSLAIGYGMPWLDGSLLPPA